MVLDVRVILSCFLLFEEDSNCFLLFSVFGRFQFHLVVWKCFKLSEGCCWLLCRPLRLFMLSLFKFNCFTLLWVVQIENVVFVFVKVFL